MLFQRRLNQFKVRKGRRSWRWQSTVFKKCDRSNHRLETSKACAADTCQHTCEPLAVEKCPHTWTLRYSVNGKQAEKSFRDKVHETSGRTLYGSGKKLRQDFQLKLTVDKLDAGLPGTGVTAAHARADVSYPGTPRASRAPPSSG
jgi:hypothetical protein